MPAAVCPDVIAGVAERVRVRNREIAFEAAVTAAMGVGLLLLTMGVPALVIAGAVYRARDAISIRPGDAALVAMAIGFVLAWLAAWRSGPV